jgi:phospholipase C
MKRKQFYVTVVLAALFLLQSRVYSDPAHHYLTATPIKHVVILFQENVSFDHYFGTYPYALNPPGEPPFYAKPNTPAINGYTYYLLHHNPNLVNPFRLDRKKVLTCDQNHEYGAEIKAYNGGLMNRFVQETGSRYDHCSPDTVMGYFDGNTVTALWNYAQKFAMDDNAFGTNFGPSTMGALNLIAGTSAGVHPRNYLDKVVNGVDIADLNPTYDDCSPHHKQTIKVIGENIGNLLNQKKITWGWFQGGFTPTKWVHGIAVCGSYSYNIGGRKVRNYMPHHEPFQYFKQTANPHHLPPSSPYKIGYPDQANHQYGLRDFWLSLKYHTMPAVCFIKAPAVGDGHAGMGYSDPLDEQKYLVNFLNRLQKTKEWKSTLVILTYDDSDGWYDHVFPPILRHSNDLKNDSGLCGKGIPATQDRCGPGPRLPFLVISPYSRENYVSHHFVEQASILKFIENNWKLGRLNNPADADRESGSILDMLNFKKPNFNPFILNPKTGEQTY